MFERKKKPPIVEDDAQGAVDGGEGRGVPLDGDDEPAADIEDRDFLWEEGDPADRRRDPLRKP